MNNRILVKVSAYESSIAFRTVTPKQKSPHWFYILRSDLERLWRDGSVITSDIHSFARLQHDRDRGVVSIRFIWLNAAGGDDLTGWEQTVCLPCDDLAEFAARSPADAGKKQWKALSLKIKRAPDWNLSRRTTSVRPCPTKRCAAGWCAACGITSTGPVQNGSAFTTIFCPAVFSSRSFGRAAQGSAAV